MEILKKLIQINSVSGQEQEIQIYIKNFLHSLGLIPIVYGGNIFVQIKGQDGDKCLIFNAHTDTVASGETVSWLKHPTNAYEHDGKIYGLGSSDNKASVAALLNLCRFFSKEKPECDLIFTFTIKEEVDGSGTKNLVAKFGGSWLKNHKIISAIVMEPTASEYFCTGHTGNMFLKVTTRGKSGHGSVPISTNEHAVLKMYKVIKKLLKLGEKWGLEYVDLKIGKPTIAVATSVKAGDLTSPNKFPDKCEATFDVRTTPKMHKMSFKMLSESIKGLGDLEYVTEPVEGASTDINSKIVQLFLNQKIKIKKFKGSSDLPFFTNIGIPGIIFGPGEPQTMHKPNEYCKIKNIKKAESILKQIIVRFGGYN